MSKLRMCRECRAWLPPNAKVCEYCGAELGPSYRQKAASESRVKFIPSESFVTAIILLLNVGIFLATVVMSMKISGGSLGFGQLHPLVLNAFGQMNPALILQGGESWRLLTAGFLHGGLFHIAMNGFALFQIGPIVEEVYGWTRYLVIFVASTIGGFFCSMLWSMYSPHSSVGASAAICGLIGAMVAVSRRSGIPVMQTIWGRWALWLVVIGLLPILYVDNAAHFGGFAVGYFIGWVAKEPHLTGKDADSVWTLLAAVSVAVTVYSLYRSYELVTLVVAAVQR